LLLLKVGVAHDAVATKPGLTATALIEETGMVPVLSRLKGLTPPLALTVIAACASLSAPSADTVYVNGKIITADKAFTIAQAVAVKDGKFVGVGTSDELRRYASPTTRVVDLKGRAVVPGLMDSHTHMIGASAAETRAPLFRAKTVAEAQAIIGEFIKSKNVPPGDWVQTSAWHPPSQLVERRYLTIGPSPAGGWSTPWASKARPPAPTTPSTSSIRSSGCTSW